MNKQFNYFCLHHLIILFSLLISITSCQNEKELNDGDFHFPIIKYEDERKAHLIDTIKMIESMPYIRCIRAFDASIDSAFYKFPQLSYLDHREKGNIIKRDSLKIFVDTNTIIKKTIRNLIPPPPPPLRESYSDEKKYICDSLKAQRQMMNWHEQVTVVQSFPVYIANPTSKTRVLEVQDSRLIMIAEALDENYEWKPIEYHIFSWCGNSYADVKIEGESFVMTDVYNYKGNFKTRMRLKLKNEEEIIYSKPIVAFINEGQFDKPKNLRLKESNFLNPDTLKNDIILETF